MHRHYSTGTSDITALMAAHRAVTQARSAALPRRSRPPGEPRPAEPFPTDPPWREGRAREMAGMDLEEQKKIGLSAPMRGVSFRFCWV